MLVRLFQSAQYTNHNAQEFKLVLETERDAITHNERTIFTDTENGVRALLAYIFSNCNGEGANKNLTHAWYFNGFGQSMSVNDVIEINDVMYQIAPVGYNELRFQEMVRQPNGSYRITDKSSEDAALEALRRKLTAYPIVNSPIEQRAVDYKQPLSRIQQIKELRTIANRLIENPENKWARVDVTVDETTHIPGTSRFTINNPARNLRFWNELTKELERAGFTIVRK